MTVYMVTMKTKVILHGIPLYINEEHYFLANFSEVSDGSSIKNGTSISTGDV